MSLGDTRTATNEKKTFYEKQYNSRISFRDYQHNTGKVMNFYYKNGMLVIAIDKAKDGECRMMTLEVRGGNGAAMELYRKLGFREVGRRPGYYAGGGEDAVLMDLALGEFEITVEV